MEVPVTFYGCVAFVLPALLRQSATTICGAEVQMGESADVTSLGIRGPVCMY